MIGFFALVGVFVVSWVFFWGLIALWKVLMGKPVPPVINNSSLKRSKGNE